MQALRSQGLKVQINQHKADPRRRNGVVSGYGTALAAAYGLVRSTIRAWRFIDQGAAVRRSLVEDDDAMRRRSKAHRRHADGNDNTSQSSKQ